MDHQLSKNHILRTTIKKVLNEKSDKQEVMAA